MKRRTFLAGSVLAVGGALLLRPESRAAPHDGYFLGLQSVLQKQGVGHPVMLIDQQRLKQNCDTLMAGLPAGRAYRIVAKSLPSVSLIGAVMAYTGTRRVMVFHQPFMNALATHIPDCDMLLGKPMPVAAARQFYAELGDAAFHPETQLQWLVDTVARLQQYLSLARELGRPMRINLELDVGLHRGGLTELSQLDECLDLIESNPEHLSFAGFMGYDAHVGKLPPVVESTRTSLQKSNAVYQSFVDRLLQRYPDIDLASLTLNGAGSPTVMLHGDDTPLNELAAGSCLVKGIDFDIAPLTDFQPAAFIATPVLKKLHGLNLPGPVPLGNLWSAWDPNRRMTWFIYGGYWKARPVSPAGLEENSVYGFSTNQMMYNSGAGTDLSVDDFIFLRPTQSEFVLLQFGDLAAVDSTGAMNWWPVLEQGHGR
jgi:D-serine deaminase-like pyridoxal phosphate-dependent protein